MDLNALNNISLLEKENKPPKKLGELEQNKPYKILSGVVTNTKFGKAVLLELEDWVVFLPNRVTETYTPYLKYFAEKKYWLVFKGTKPTKKPNPAAIFEIIEK